MKFGMLHTCIRVMDLEKSLDFYKNALGLKVVKELDYPEYEFSLVYLSDEEENYELELTYNYNPEKPYELGNGFSHIALSVKDLEVAHSKHKDLGYEVTDMKGLPGNPPNYFFVKDPDGYSVEIIREK
mgnify:CR=1 FL=1